MMPPQKTVANVVQAPSGHSVADMSKRAFKEFTRMISALLSFAQRSSTDVVKYMFPSAMQPTPADMIETEVKYHDPSTWPRQLTAAQIQRVLESRLTNPAAPLNYESLAALQQLGDFKSTALLLSPYVKAPDINVHTFLAGYFKVDSGGGTGRRGALHGDTWDEMERALLVGCGERRLLVCHASSHKEAQELIWLFLCTARASAVKCGRVLVLNGDALVQGAPRGVCDAIRQHVWSVTGVPQDAHNYRNTKQAYDTWEIETVRRFRIPAGENVDPLLVLTDVLPRPLLEELSVAIPSPNSVVAIGPSAQILDQSLLSRVNVTYIALKREH